jgi:hypothetical protein
MLRGRRFGNVVLAAAAAPDGLPVARLAAALRRSESDRGRLVHGTALDEFVAGARPLTNTDNNDTDNKGTDTGDRTG